MFTFMAIIGKSTFMGNGCKATGLQSSLLLSFWAALWEELTDQMLPTTKPPQGLVLSMSPGRMNRAEIRVYEVSPSISKFYCTFPTTTCCFLAFIAQKFRLKDCRQHAPGSWR